MGPTNPSGKHADPRRALAGSLVLVAAYTIAEEMFGLAWGLVVGIAIGLCEIAWERRREGRVSPLTWGANLLVIGLGGVSFATSDGAWLKMQPAIVEGVMAAVLLGSAALKRPILAVMLKKQGVALPPRVAPVVEAALGGITWRMGLFMLAQSGLAAWAAVAWPTRAWAALKGIGLPASLLVYAAVEGFALRSRVVRAQAGSTVR